MRLYRKLQEVGANIRQYRKLRGLTQAQLAEMAHISTMSVRRYESGEREVSENTLRTIAFVLGVDAKYLDDRLDVPWERLGSEEIYSLSDGSLASMPYWTDEAKLLRAYMQLSLKARKIAIERIEELAKIPEYQAEQSKAASGATNTESGKDDTDH